MRMQTNRSRITQIKTISDFPIFKQMIRSQIWEEDHRCSNQINSEMIFQILAKWAVVKIWQINPVKPKLENQIPSKTLPAVLPLKWSNHVEQRNHNSKINKWTILINLVNSYLKHLIADVAEVWAPLKSFKSIHLNACTCNRMAIHNLYRW